MRRNEKKVAEKKYHLKIVQFLHVSLEKTAQHSNTMQMNSSLKKRQRNWKNSTTLPLPFYYRGWEFPMEVKEYSYFMLLCVSQPGPITSNPSEKHMAAGISSHICLGNCFVPLRPDHAPLQRGVSRISNCIKGKVKIKKECFQILD